MLHRLRYSSFVSTISLIGFFALPLAAQFNASLQGTVRDNSGGAVPAAHVKIVNQSTQATREADTDAGGLYRFNQIPPGNYTVNIEAKGFRTTTLNDVNVIADRPQTADASIELGKVEETVTVTAAPPALQNTDANITNTIGSRSIQTLPAFGRDPFQLVRLTPGITGTGARSGAGGVATLGNNTGPGGSSRSIFQTENQVQVSSAGQRVSSNDYQLDGVSINSLQWGGAAVVTPNAESVAEINVVATSYDASDGRNSGAHTKVVSKNGTNDLHGSALFRFQDPGFNAYNKYGGLNSAPPVRVETKFRQYAGSVGGPILKNKLFFFASYEGLSNKSQTFTTRWVETPQFASAVQQSRPNSLLARMLAGPANRPRIAQVLPSTCSQLRGNAFNGACAALPGGLDIGSLRAGASAANPYLADAVRDNGNGLDGTPDIQFIQYFNPQRIVGNQFNLRGDYNITNNDLVAVSAYVTKLNQVLGSDSVSARPSGDVWFKPLSQAVTALYIHNFSTNTVNELRTNFTRYADNGLQDNIGTNWGIPTVEVETYPFDRIRAGGPFRSETTPSILAQNTYETRDTVTTIVGPHTFRVGAQFRWEQNNNNLLGGSRPIYSFQGIWNWANDAPVFEGLNQDPTTGGVATGQRYYRTKNFAGFVQDDWNVRPGLKINLGLRWEYFSPITEARGRQTNLALGYNGPQPVIDARVIGVDRLYNANFHHYMPKIGFAWSPSFANNKLVLRGGFATAYNRQSTALFSNGAGNPPYFARYSLCCGNSGSPFNRGLIQYTFGNGLAPTSYPSNRAVFTGINPRSGAPNALPDGTVPAVEIYGAPSHLPESSALLYSFEAQTEIAPDTVLTLGYQGTGGRHIVRLVNQNFLYSAANSPFYAVYFPTPDTTSAYNGLNARVSHRFAKGFQADVIYTWSKSIDYLSAEGPGATTNQTNPAYLPSERGPSDYDARHRLSVNGLWDLPIYKTGKGLLTTLLGGWQLGGIITAYTGYPWTPVTGNLQSIAPVTGANTIAPTRPIGYFGNAGVDTSNDAFLNATNFGGNSRTSVVDGTRFFDISRGGSPGIGRNSFRGPHYFAIDASASKRFRLPFWNERIAFEFRANAYNLFNILNLTPFNFGADNTKVENPNFGRADGSFAGRSFEFQGRFTF